MRGFIIAKLMPLCGSIGAFKKQQNGNDTVGATLTADQAPYSTRAGTVAERQIAYLASIIRTLISLLARTRPPGPRSKERDRRMSYGLQSLSGPIL